MSWVRHFLSENQKDLNLMSEKLKTSLDLIFTPS